MFLSTTNRAFRVSSRLEFKKDSSNPNLIKNFTPDYNTQYYSIAESVRRRVESGLGNPMLARLRAKSKLVAPFNSCADRFKAKQVKEHEKFLGPGYYEFKSFIDKEKPKSINPQFLSSEQRFSGAFDGGKSKVNQPGPGTYNKGGDNPWDKKTFNITYEY
jgi:hypothetical protein